MGARTATFSPSIENGLWVRQRAFPRSLRRRDAERLDHLLVGPVEPENAVHRRGLILGMGLKEILTLRTGQNAELGGAAAGEMGFFA